MASPSAPSALADALLSFTAPEEFILSRVHQIHEDVLSHSPNIRQANFPAIHPRDLEFLFAIYDEQVFGGLCRRALEKRRLAFRLSPRMTRTGGTTTQYRAPNGEVSYELAIAISMLFDGFGETDRRITVCGLECKDRLEALQRIFEHEMVHLAEQLCWGRSDCTAARFQDIAERLFLHRAHTHDLITRRERAAESGIQLGSRVAFTFEGKRLTGRVNRITKRATVLVEDPEGPKYSDGLRYKTYYVPISWLEPVVASPGGSRTLNLPPPHPSSDLGD
jgi:hypothetical protein